MASPEADTWGWFLTLHRWAVERRSAMSLLQEHRRWVLRQHRAGRILISGPGADRDLGIMIVRAPNAGAVEDLFTDEPWLANGMRTVEIIPWDVHELFGTDLLVSEGVKT